MSGFGPALYDFDNDGWKDFFVTRGQVTSVWPPGYKFAEPNVVFRNLGSSGKWQALTNDAGFTEATAARHRGCAMGDFNGDGHIDIVATSLDEPAELWMNRSPNIGHWLDIALRGVKSNRDGIGARIKVATNAGAQYNHQTSSVCYASSSLGPVHFGLGKETKANTVEIHWPSGIVQTLQNVQADQVLKVTEPVEGASPKN
jgi:enediyne biosynthesis protein E4